MGTERPAEIEEVAEESLDMSCLLWELAYMTPSHFSISGERISR